MDIQVLTGINTAFSLTIQEAPFLIFLMLTLHLYILLNDLV